MNEKKHAKRWDKAAAILLLLAGLTACTNPLTSMVQTAPNTLSETENLTNNTMDTRKLELRKIEPDIYTAQETNQEIEDESVPLESKAPAPLYFD